MVTSQQIYGINQVVQMHYDFYSRENKGQAKGFTPAFMRTDVTQGISMSACQSASYYEASISLDGPHSPKKESEEYVLDLC